MFGRRGRNRIEEIVRKLYLARAKLEMSHRMRLNSDYRRIAAAAIYTGTVFATPMFMSNLYYNSAIKDVKKAVKSLGKMAKDTENEHIKQVLNGVIASLSRIEELDYTSAVEALKSAEISLIQLRFAEEA